MVSAAAQHLNGWSDLQLCLLNRDGQGGWKVETGGPLEFTEAERAAADWAWQHDQPAGAGTGTLPFGRWWWWPLSVEDGPLALLGVSAKEGQTLGGQRRRLLTALSQPLAQALARAQLADDLEAARLHGETEQLRSALLASVSHDLRTPLTAMRGSIDSLLALGEAYPDLKASGNFQSLQNELGDVEDKLAAARRALNAAAARFNSARESFPAVLFAGMLGFGAADFDRLAESEKGTVDQTPKVAF